MLISLSNQTSREREHWDLRITGPSKDKRVNAEQLRRITDWLNRHPNGISGGWFGDFGDFIVMGANGTPLTIRPEGNPSGEWHGKPCREIKIPPDLKVRPQHGSFSIKDKLLAAMQAKMREMRLLTFKRWQSLIY